jgi:threonine synthase
MSETRSYTCENCGGTFEDEWTEAEAVAEYRKLFPADEKLEEAVPICDPCYEEITAWARSEGMLK